MSAYTFNQRNQLISVGTLSANYDAQGRRTELTRNGQITKFTLNPLSSFNQVLISENYLGEKTYYVYGLGLISEEKNSEMSYYHFDFRGSTIALTDASELVTDTFEYDAYGKVMSHTGSSATMFKYVGQYGVTTDTDTLYFMMTRYYSPEMRRFISQDTVVGSIASVLSTNQFIYAVNNPIILIDFDGEKPKTLNPSYTPNSLTSQKGKGTKEQWQSIEWQDGVKEQYMFTASITAGFTPLDTAVDLATLVLGYDPITGDNVSRLAALGFLLVPEAIEASVKGLAKTVANSEGIIKGTGNAIKGGLETGIIAKNGIKIEGFTSHGVDRAIGDGMKRAGVKPEAILDAIKNPLKINDVVTDQFGRQSQRFIGETAEVVINPLTGKIVSINPTSSSKAAKLLKELGVQK